jgi:hypothetical protein
LKKFKILPFGLPAGLLLTALFAPCRPLIGTLLFAFARGVRGFGAGVRGGMLDVDDLKPLLAFGGVGGRPADGFVCSLNLREDSRGLRNMARDGLGHHVLVLQIGFLKALIRLPLIDFASIDFTRRHVTTSRPFRRDISVKESYC